MEKNDLIIKIDRWAEFEMRISATGYAHRDRNIEGKKKPFIISTRLTDVKLRHIRTRQKVFVFTIQPTLASIC